MPVADALARSRIVGIPSMASPDLLVKIVVDAVICQKSG